MKDRLRKRIFLFFIIVKLSQISSGFQPLLIFSGYGALPHVCSKSQFLIIKKPLIDFDFIEAMQRLLVIVLVRVHLQFDIGLNRSLEFKFPKEYPLWIKRR